MSAWFKVTIPVTIRVWGEDAEKVLENINKDLQNNTFSFNAYADWVVEGNVKAKEE